VAVPVGADKEITRAEYTDIDLKLNEMAREIVNITCARRRDILGLQARTNDNEPLVSTESVESGLPEGSREP
jgi:hypothetical protein